MPRQGSKFDEDHELRASSNTSLITLNRSFHETIHVHELPSSRHPQQAHAQHGRVSARLHRHLLHPLDLDDQCADARTRRRQRIAGPGQRDPQRHPAPDRGTYGDLANAGRQHVPAS
ncbi:conserved hypothetical protein, partial [Ricinus communis]